MSINVQVSSQFKSSLAASIASIILFIVTYLLLFAFSIALVIGCGFLALMLVSRGVTLNGIVFAVGIMAIGLLIFYYVIKYFFKYNKASTDKLISITSKDYPEIFEIINKVTQKVGTKSPHKVYLSPDVNASVTYNSSFLSLLFPIRKNLIIGYPLLITYTQEELAAILAHEFGHFAQKSMHVGSYVYYSNNIIYDMLYDNEGVNNVLSGCASNFAVIAAVIIRGIQAILQRVYKIVNINYLKLSREMEFHADEIATNVAGSKVFVDALRKIEKASTVYYYTINLTQAVYDKEQKLFPNFFTNFKYCYTQECKQEDASNIIFEKKSKLQFQDLWSTHPSTEDRIAAIEVLDIPRKRVAESDSFHLEDKISDEEELTRFVYDSMDVKMNQIILEPSVFEEKYNSLQNDEFPINYNTYYNNISVFTFDIDEEIDKEATIKIFDDFFNDDILDRVQSIVTLSADINQLYDIENGVVSVKHFYYDKDKYKKADSKYLINKLEEEISQEYDFLRHHEQDLFRFLYHKAKQKGNTDEFVKQYKHLFEIQDFMNKINNEASAIQQMLYNMMQISDPQSYYDKNRNIEIEFLESSNRILENPIYEISSQDKDDFIYFAGYINDTTYNKLNNTNYFQTLVNVINVATSSVSAVHFKELSSFHKFRMSLID